ncbi:MAG: hypothetical protein IJ157_02290 [Clostridia bacterium]|nr:hypothetical protein [Clostridia bacterium]
MRISIDIDYDFRADSNGKDPDAYSKALRAYHQFLWSKPLPSKGILELDRNLNNVSSCGAFSFASDSIMPTYSYWDAYQSIIKQIDQRQLQLFEHHTYTIGGMIIFPRNRIENKMTINMSRGVNKYIRDRFDLTLECIRRYYRREKSPLYDCLRRYASFFDLFDGFDGYVSFFFLQDLLADDQSIRFFLPFSDFSKDALPQTPNAYYDFMENSIQFIERRAQRIAKWSMSVPESR